MADRLTLDAMRSDWDLRAQQDAHYFVAFGRLGQSEEEFFSSAADQVRLFEAELERRPSGFWSTATALEIGCGPGRLLRPLSRHFQTLYGVDISQEMLDRAARVLRGVDNVRLLRASSSDLSGIADETIDFIYSYAVFQHIPDERVVFAYWEDAVRVLRPGGLFAFQVNGQPPRGHIPNTWEGCRISPGAVKDFATQGGLLLLGLTDKDTQYMWVTLQKPFSSSPDRVDNAVKIFRITAVYTGEPVVPASGRFGAASVWMSGLPDTADLHSLTALVDNAPAECCYVGPPLNGHRNLNLILPPGTRSGLVPIELFLNGKPLGEPARVRIIPVVPRIPSISSVSDGVNLRSLFYIETGSVKLTMDEIANPESLEICIGNDVVPYQWFCVNPLHERYEFNFDVPGHFSGGSADLRVRVGGKQFAPIPLVVARTAQGV